MAEGPPPDETELPVSDSPGGLHADVDELISALAAVLEMSAQGPAGPPDADLTGPDAKGRPSSAEIDDPVWSGPAGNGASPLDLELEAPRWRSEASLDPPALDLQIDDPAWSGPAGNGASPLDLELEAPRWRSEASLGPPALDLEIDDPFWSGPASNLASPLDLALEGPRETAAPRTSDLDAEAPLHAAFGLSRPSTSPHGDASPRAPSSPTAGGPR